MTEKHQSALCGMYLFIFCAYMYKFVGWITFDAYLEIFFKLLINHFRYPFEKHNDILSKNFLSKISKDVFCFNNLPISGTFENLITVVLWLKSLVYKSIQNIYEFERILWSKCQFFFTLTTQTSCCCGKNMSTYFSVHVWFEKTFFI